VNECIDVAEQHPTKAGVVVLLRTSLHKRLRRQDEKTKLNLSDLSGARSNLTQSNVCVDVIGCHTAVAAERDILHGQRRW
jgi:hypothetical protein